MSKFVHLHVHSHYSLLNGLTKIKPLVQAAKKRGFDALAITDYGSMYGALEFYKVCQAEGIKPIIGFEAYIAPRTLHDKDIEKDKEMYQMILLAENFKGYQNLMKISSIGHLEGFFNDKPRIDKELLRELGEGIIALSGPIESEISQLLKKGNIEKAKEVALTYQDIFGKENFYLELQDHPAIEGQMSVNTKMIQLSKDTGIPMVVTRDVHYLDYEDAEAQDILRCISKGWKVFQTDREDMRHVDRSLNTAQDISSRFKHVPEAIENTVKIAERINLDIPLNNWHFAPVEKRGNLDYDEMIREDAFKHAPKFYPDMGNEIVKRIEYELDIIKTKGYSPYFLCVADYVHYAKTHGIVESTRGSAAGSLVSYVLGITTVDPIRFKLPFERFLNPLRPSAPDVDTDFADDRRDEMIEYVTKKYGEDRVAQLITFGTMAARGSVRDVGRALGLSYSFCDQVSKLIPQGAQGHPMTIERALVEEPDLKKLFDSNEDVKRLLTLAQKVEGCARHTSMHAAGVLISPTPLTDFTPIQRETGGDRITSQYDMYCIEDAGVLKNDFLGIRNLSILGKAVEIVKKTKGDDVDIYHLPLDDSKVFEMISRGETMGVFQFASSGMIRWLKELKPTNIDDIMAMVALYRPGPMDFIPEYIRRKQHPETIDYPHPDLEDILEKSLGLLIYQDDIMLTAIKLAGYDWLEADKFRKAMGKKIPELMVEQEMKFQQGCIKNNISKEVVTDLWNRIKPFASYGFNKAHAASYGMVAYQTAYMKAHYPVQYMTAILQAEFGDTEKVSAIVGECRRMGIKVLPPDVNESFKNFAMVSKDGEEGRIRFGLTAIKNVGDAICEAIYRERKEHGQYKSLEDLLERVDNKDLNKRSLQSMAEAGALDCFGYDRAVLIASMDSILGYIKQYRERKISNQDSLFAGTSIELDSKVHLQDVEPASMEEKSGWEKKLLGIYVSSHPFTYYKKIMKDKVVDLIDVEDMYRDEWVVAGGVVESIHKKITKKGKQMMFATIQDETASMELLIFPKAYEVTKYAWEVGNILCVIGKTPREHGENKIFVEKAYVMNKENVHEVTGYIRAGSDSATKIEKEKSKKYISIRLTADEAHVHGPKLKEIFEQHIGSYDVYFKIGLNTIHGQVPIKWGDELMHEIEDVIGEGKIDVND